MRPSGQFRGLGEKQQNETYENENVARGRHDWSGCFVCSCWSCLRLFIRFAAAGAGGGNSPRCASGGGGAGGSCAIRGGSGSGLSGPGLRLGTGLLVSVRLQPRMGSGLLALSPGLRASVSLAPVRTEGVTGFSRC